MATIGNPNEKKVEGGTSETLQNKEADVIESTRSDLHLQSLLSQKPDEVEVVKVSETKETRAFSEQEILKVALEACELRKLNVEKLKISRIVRNEKGEIVALYTRMPNEKNDGGSIEITFILQGKHGGNNSANTNISQWDFDKDGMPDRGGEIFAEFVDGKWVLGRNPIWVVRDPKTNEVIETKQYDSDGKLIDIPKK
jgi:hypothetical protein